MSRKAEMESRARSGEPVGLLAFVDGSPVGWCSVAPRPTYSRLAGAQVLEAYPVEPDSPSYRFGGFVPPFERRGFAFEKMAGSRRHVMSLHLANTA